MNPNTKEWSREERREVALLAALPVLGAAILTVALFPALPRVWALVVPVAVACAFVPLMLGVVPLFSLSRRLRWQKWFHFAIAEHAGVVAWCRCGWFQPPSPRASVAPWACKAKAWRQLRCGCPGLGR